MKIILSRKGFDSSSGGMPSPLFPDGRITSIPIPAKQAPTRLKSLRARGKRLGAIVTELSRSRIDKNQPIHLDPDIDYHALYRREEGWCGAFGQSGAAQKHLQNAGVGPGDLFLFFGWFKPVEKYQNRWRFVPHSKDQHIIYGWLQVADVLPVNNNVPAILERYPWLHRHPHLFEPDQSNNCLYIASHRSDGHAVIPNIPSYGIFPQCNPCQILTDPQQNKRSLWRLPIGFYPESGKPPLSYHQDLSRWKKMDSQWLNLQSVARGQEFVLDYSCYPELKNWLRQLFSFNF